MPLTSGARYGSFEIVSKIVDVLRLPADQATRALAGVNVGAFPIPSPTRINEQRAVIRAARQRVLDAVTQ